jgi:hypothetical protein
MSSFTFRCIYVKLFIVSCLQAADLFLLLCNRQVVQIFHSHITEAFSKLEVSTPQAKNRYAA